MSRRVLPPELPILSLKADVLLPAASLLLQVTEPKECALVELYLWQDSEWSSKYIGVVPLVNGKLHPVGVAASVAKIRFQSHPLPSFSLLLNGLCRSNATLYNTVLFLLRFQVDKIVQEVPYKMAAITQLVDSPSEEDTSPEVEELALKFRKSASELVDLLRRYSPNSRMDRIKNIIDLLPGATLPDFFISLIKASNNEKIDILDSTDVVKRFKTSQPLLNRHLETVRVLSNRLPKKSTILSNREQFDGEEDELMELERKIESAGLPEHALKVAKKELKRLRALPTQFPEHSVARNYIDTLLDLPWTTSTTDKLNIAQASEELDTDHYGLEKVKKRILEYLAVIQLNNSLKGPILCLVGAPGVGKTSIGRSIAQTMGRKFHRLSVGGVCDQSDIRGHRRTYIGSMPGRVIQGLRTVRVNNPVILLDEIDKLSKGIHGDPASALLEVLDPEQNHAFTDHYLGIPFDLSQVLFIATANTTSSIPSALLDRMEVIHIPGYTIEEKAQIANRHLIPKLLKTHGLTEHQLLLPVDIIERIAINYTRESGVRELERQLSAICRAIAMKRAQGDTRQVNITNDIVEAILGPRKYELEAAERLIQPGVAIGLAWTPSGGKILFVEATSMKGKGKLTLTGQLGSVMRESANIALNWLRANSTHYQLNCSSDLSQLDIHIHFPAGAVEKDGPSAGVTIVTVLASMFSGCRVRSDVAMTGEITLRGLVLPVGGVKEKILAAHRAGIESVILPKRNEKDLIDLPSSVRKTMNILLVQSIEEVLEIAFDGRLSKTEPFPYQSKL